MILRNRRGEGGGRYISDVACGWSWERKVRMISFCCVDDTLALFMFNVCI